MKIIDVLSLLKIGTMKNFFSAIKHLVLNMYNKYVYYFPFSRGLKFLKIKFK